MTWTFLESALLVIASLHLIKAPYTKVEESFNLQAIHDIINYGVFDISKYDHLQFPGAVPRTFIGALIVSGCLKPFLWISSLWNGSDALPTQLETQLLARGVIALINCLSIIYLKEQYQALVDRESGAAEDDEGNKINTHVKNDFSFTSAGNWFLLFFMSSFHMMFYCSRPLPNFVVAFSLTNLALAMVLKGKYEWSIGILAFASVVFRLEIAALGVGITLCCIYFKKVSIFKAIRFGVMGLSLGISLSLFVDSYFWKNWGIPEIDSFIFNVVEGNSSNWGTESFFAYFNKYVPMLFLPPTALILNYAALKFAPTDLKIVAFASYFHILILSLQPHKEWRFIVYAVPSIMLLGSLSAAYLWENVKVENFMNALYLISLPATPLISFILSMLFLYISRMNYPGGDALFSFNNYIINHNVTDVTVHISVPPCMTGVSLFGELDYDRYAVTYDRTENIQSLTSLWKTFDYAILLESSMDSFQLDTAKDNEWEIIQTTQMFMGLNYTYINDLFFDEERNIPEIFRVAFTNRTIGPFFTDLVENSIVKSDIFYTYKRISKD
ncbi:similar to Saccharomyces cerevisiae YNR030W ALG12 Alpha-1,6-mannosyltransferase localized to the ER [Maudiozyma barnettii]|uniref:Mannosyltransferase n=1 Tax=Maudiozyma barnettii TaxID=61262 RepID=A0A8H2VHC2_9SACH|nr:dolichyl-P-Man:Man(7)GlcNAc(2)-PP-dolichol alpha-1,6-mannosyltransferase [Kazachstania barnettii]CAB4255415.1 similar to Saccharomyces cerevisiae YNR030W ALG12 Alpha-1,6-mannosyltransferase localized to the ER [Kazachstania barnettii]CAD1783833.1 similar to Saccharomyces cerevisiae YNR030W ALG12 Alpha-1,6-mannosyltransferase localized to the ER [Kazachstania barnettii]